MGDAVTYLRPVADHLLRRPASSWLTDTGHHGSSIARGGKTRVADTQVAPANNYRRFRRRSKFAAVLRA